MERQLRPEVGGAYPREPQVRRQTVTSGPSVENSASVQYIKGVLIVTSKLVEGQMKRKYFINISE